MIVNMNENVLMPDYNHSILNLITSILKNYKIETKYNSLEKIDDLLKKQYKNVVLVILDGMGENVLRNASPNGILSKNKIDTITSVYPCTTAAAMTTYYSGKPPIETGWIAWSQYFKEYGKNINVFPETDSFTNEKLRIKSPKVSELIGYKTVYEQIKEQNIGAYEIMPSNCAKKAKIVLNANTIEEMCEGIVTLCESNENKFIMAYNDNPDYILHETGCYSEQTKQFILKTEQEFEKMVKKLKDTLVIVSADHGHQDIKENIDILELKELQDCLLIPATLEPRM